MKFSRLTMDEIMDRHRKGEKVIITNVARFPSEMFPIGTFPTVRMYTGRNETNWGETCRRGQGRGHQNGTTEISSLVS
jgi:hypothetical protein